MSKKITVLGGGISGLAASYWLFKAGYDVVVLEKNSEVGGAMESINENGYLFDSGPNSGLETTPLISQLVNEVGLSNEFIYANPVGDKRYVLRDNKLHQLPMTPLAFYQTNLFSGKAKLRLLAEPLIGRSKDGYYQSVAQFVKRRLGQEFLDYAINPFVAGVYAGNPGELSVKSAFPKLYALEEKYGSLIIGTVRSIKERRQSKETSKKSAKMFSFKSGMQIFPKAISSKLGNKIITSAEVISVNKETAGYTLNTVINGKSEMIKTDMIVFAIPAYAASNLFKKIDPNLSKHLDSIYYPPLLVIYAGFKKQDILQKLDGFGFLIPAIEKKLFLGAIWSSVIFVNRSPGNIAAFTLFVGGARNPELFNINKEQIIKNVLEEFKKLMRIRSEPVFLSSRFWEKAIPQYNIGYIEHEKYIDDFEKINPGIVISGNFRGGISVGDCIKNSETVFNKIVHT
jgi:oxygen-dependent protoporphyrinogen oxidase